MRIWKGIEQEGQYKGECTLFIESSTISVKELDIVIGMCDTNIQQLYFGAGKVPVCSISDSAISVLETLSNKYRLTIEHPITAIELLPSGLFHNIIGSIDVEVVPDTIKLDNGKFVYSNSVDTFITTNLQSLNNGIYVGNDIVVYED